MGNYHSTMASSSSLNEVQPGKSTESIETFQFHENFIEESNNGLCLNNIYLPEEVVMMILSYVEPKEILAASLVCKKWCNIIKSDLFWAEIYARRYHRKAKKLPWYVYYSFFSTNYYNTNLIKNGNGQDQYNHWNIILNYGDAFVIEDPPNGSDPLPAEIPEFNGKTSCFATSYYECNKLQAIEIKNKLLQLILHKYKPHIYVSEWVAGRFDCGCVYTLWCRLFGEKQCESKEKQREPRRRNRVNILRRLRMHEDSSSEEYHEEPLFEAHTRFSVEQWAGKAWTKVELLVKNYPEGVNRIVFQHEGRDTQFWKGHYGSKMAGGVLKILFDSIEPEREE